MAANETANPRPGPSRAPHSVEASVEGIGRTMSDERTAKRIAAMVGRSSPLREIASRSPASIGSPHRTNVTMIADVTAAKRAVTLQGSRANLFLYVIRRSNGFRSRKVHCGFRGSHDGSTCLERSLLNIRFT